MLALLVTTLTYTSAARNKYVSEKKINVKDFGAKGDGNSDDTQPILAAFKEVLASGGVVYFPSGNYLTNIIDIKANAGIDIKVVGDGGKTIIKKRKEDPTNVALFFCESKDVSMSFSDLVLKGTLLEKNGFWITKEKNKVDVEKSVNGIYGYNLKELNVTNCVVSDFHGRGIAAFNTRRFVAIGNTVNNTSGSGIMGHRVDSMFAQRNVVSNTGVLGESYYLDGKLTVRAKNFPLTIFGDGIEGDCNHLIATDNIITNPGRCGVVHDLAKDLGYQTSSARVRNNQIVIGSLAINNSNPPAGMWLEQGHNVEVVNNQITVSKSTSQIVSGIRFYGITGKISCANNRINATGYNLVVQNGIGIFEPETDQVEILGNIISGKYDAGIMVSYGGERAQIKSFQVLNNQISGIRTKNGIEMAAASARSLPLSSTVKRNSFNGIEGEVVKIYYYGADQGKKKATSLLWQDNKVNSKPYKLQKGFPKGLVVKQ